MGDELLEHVEGGGDDAAGRKGEEREEGGSSEDAEGSGQEPREQGMPGRGPVGNQTDDTASEQRGTQGPGKRRERTEALLSHGTGGRR